MIYYSVLCSNYLTLFGVLIAHKVSFEYHSKLNGCGRCYADFYLPKSRSITFDVIAEKAAEIEANRGKTLTLQIINKYEV